MKVAKNSTLVMALMIGIMKFTIFFFYAWAMFFGSRFLERDSAYTQKQVLIVIIALITGFVQLISALPNIQALMALKQMGALIFSVIDREPRIRNSPNCLKG